MVKLKIIILYHDYYIILQLKYFIRQLIADVLMYLNETECNRYV